MTNIYTLALPVPVNTVLSVSWGSLFSGFQTYLLIKISWEAFKNWSSSFLLDQLNQSFWGWRCGIFVWPSFWVILGVANLFLVQKWSLGTHGGPVLEDDCSLNSFHSSKFPVLTSSSEDDWVLPFSQKVRPLQKYPSCSLLFLSESCL